MMLFPIFADSISQAETITVEKALLALMPAILSGIAAWFGATRALANHRKTTLHNEKLSRYMSVLKALSALLTSLRDHYDEETGEFLDNCDLGASRAAWTVIEDLRRERNFVISAESAKVILDFDRDWPSEDCFYPPSFKTIERAQLLVRDTIKKIVRSGQKDMGWEKKEKINLDGYWDKDQN